MNPMQGLLRSRKFLVLVLDVVISLLLYFGSKYAAPAVLDDMTFVIAVLQPVALFLIGAIAYEDGQAKRFGTHYTQVDEWDPDTMSYTGQLTANDTLPKDVDERIPF